jgi:CYTH domain-containing protein
VAGATFGSALTRIGNNEGGGDGFIGQIAEIDIYSGALSSIQISNIEAQLTANYGAISSIATNRIAMTAAVSGNQLYLSWPASHTGWRLEVQTNNLIQGVSVNPNDWTTVAGSTATNQTTITIESAQPAEFYRLVYP